MAKVSIIIPSRNERFLQATVADLLAKARGDVEVIVLLDGYWPDPPLPQDKRLKALHFGEAHGMRPGINAAVHMATGEYLLKCDAHTLWDEGYDEKLKADYHQDDWVVVPRRYALDGEKWERFPADSRYPVDAHFLSYPYERPGDGNCGLHGDKWPARREARKDILIDDEMSSQGSAWFMSQKHFARIGPLDVLHYGTFAQEFQEIGCTTWLTGGAVKVNKKTWYAHLYKGKKWGRGYSAAGNRQPEGQRYCVDFWMNDRPLKNRVHDLRWLLEHFIGQSGPIPTWPRDLDEAFRVARTTPWPVAV